MRVGHSLSSAFVVHTSNIFSSKAAGQDQISQMWSIHALVFMVDHDQDIHVWQKPFKNLELWNLIDLQTWYTASGTRSL